MYFTGTVSYEDYIFFLVVDGNAEKEKSVTDRNDFISLTTGSVAIFHNAFRERGYI